MNTADGGKRRPEDQVKTERVLRGELQRLQKEVARLAALNDKLTAENETLTSRASANAYEAASLRRLLAEMRHSLSWRITAPLRFLSRPLFRALAPKTVPQSIPLETPPGDAVSPAQSRPAVEAVLTEIRRAQSVVVIPCAIPFSSTLSQRPISCARYLADRGSTVLYVAWQWTPEEEIPHACEEVYPGVLNVPLYTFLGHMDGIAAASQAKSSYICTLPSPALVDAVRPLRAAGYHIHYDIMDDWQEFHRGGEAPWYSAVVEREMVLLADTVTAVSQVLADKFDHLRSDIVVVRNGYDPAALACPQFIAARGPVEESKVVGYFGHLSDAWFNWDALFYAAEKLPDLRFELIGWGLSDQSRLRIEDSANIRHIGLVPQKELHQYASKWCAGVIPFAPTALSAAVDPLKIYEYLHLGLQTVVTGISGIAGYPLVRFTRDREEFASALAAIPGPPDQEKLTEVREFLKGCLWNERLAQLNAVISRPAGLPFLYAR